MSTFVAIAEASPHPAENGTAHSLSQYSVHSSAFTICSGPSQSDYLVRLPIHRSGRVSFVRTEDVDWIEADGNYALLHIGEHVAVLRRTLTSLASDLNPKQFVRIHRSTIVNKSKVREILSWSNGYHKVVLETGRQLRMSRYQQRAKNVLMD